LNGAAGSQINLNSGWSQFSSATASSALRLNGASLSGALAISSGQTLTVSLPSSVEPMTTLSITAAGSSCRLAVNASLSIDVTSTLELGGSASPVLTVTGGSAAITGSGVLTLANCLLNDFVFCGSLQQAPFLFVGMRTAGLGL
jgi:hypothetical protein